MYRVDTGYDLDQYLFNRFHDGPDDFLEWELDISDDYGPVDASGHPVSGHQLFGKDLLLTVRAYDVDSDSGEVDHLYVNGTRVGEALTGADDQWSTNTFEVPSRLLKFPTNSNPNGTNSFHIEIDVNDDGWAVEVDWVELRPRTIPAVPVVFVHGLKGEGKDMKPAEDYFKSRNGKLKTHKPSTSRLGGLYSNAARLSDAVDNLLKDEPVNQVDVVSYSRGGLDSRAFAYWNKGMVRNLIMIATPNGGSFLADSLCNGVAAARVATLGARYFETCQPGTSYDNLRTKFVKDEFNKKVPDHPNTRYYTIAGVGNRWDWGTDGTVSVDSVFWLDRKSPPRGSKGGRHQQLGKVYRHHTNIDDSGSPAFKLAYDAIYGSSSGKGGGGQTQGQAQSAEPLEGELNPEELAHVGGVFDHVPAGTTRTYPLAIAPGEEGVLLLPDQDGLTASVTGAVAEESGFFSDPATTYTFTGPQTLSVTNTGAVETELSGSLFAYSKRELEAEVPSLVAAGQPALLTATLSGATGADVVSYGVLDEDQNVVAKGLLTRGAGEVWSTEVTMDQPGRYSLSVQVEGDRPRVAGAPIEVHRGGAIGDEISSESLTDEDADGRYDALNVTIPVTTQVTGRYAVGASILDGNGDVVARGLSDPAELPAGPGETTIQFIGKELGNSRTPGPWYLSEVTLSDKDLATVDYVDQLGAISHDDAASYERDLITVSGFAEAVRDTDEDGSGDYLDIEFGADVSESGDFAVNGRLVSLDGTEVARAQTVIEIDEGDVQGVLSFSADDIRAAEMNGPFILRDFSIYPLDLAADGVSLVDAFTTRAYGFEDLGQLSLTHDGSLSIAGTPRAGETLSVSEQPTWSPEADVTLQWLRDRSAVAGATDAAYDLTAADVEKRISLQLTARAVGYDDAEVVSDAVTVAKGVLSQDGALTVGGTPQVGETLTITQQPTWSPEPAVQIEWLRDDSPIDGAGGTSYNVTSADEGTAVRVRLTATRDGYEPDSALSSAMTIRSEESKACTDAKRDLAKAASAKKKATTKLQKAKEKLKRLKNNQASKAKIKKAKAAVKQAQKTKTKAVASHKKAKKNVTRSCR